MKKIKVLFLALMLICTMGVVKAAQITEINVTFDEEKAKPSPKYTLMTHSNALCNQSIGKLGPMHKENAVDGYYFLSESNNHLCYWENNRWNSYSQKGWNNSLSTNYQYALKLECNVDIDNGYTVDTANIKNIKVKVNGKDWAGAYAEGWNDYWGFFYVYIPIEMDLSPCIAGVRLLNDSENVSIGTSKQLTWELENPYGANSDKLIFEVSGNNSASTIVTSGGLLQVAPSETAKTLKVKATSAVDSTVSHEITLNVLGEPLNYTKFEINPQTAVAYKGTLKTFKAVVEGTAPKACTWSVINANDEGTVIDQSGNLTVGPDESSTNLMVVLTSNWDSSFVAKAPVTIGEKTQVKRIDISIDFSKIKLSSALKYEQLNYELIDNEKGDLKITSEGAYVVDNDSVNNSFRIWKDSCYDSVTRYWEENVDPKAKYAVGIDAYIDRNNGYFIDSDNLDDIEIYLNGEKVTPYDSMSWNDYWGSVSVDIEVDSSLFELESFELGDVNGDGVVNVEDAGMILDIYKGNVQQTPELLARGDMDNNGVLDVQDAGKILDKYKGL